MLFPAASSFTLEERMRSSQIDPIRPWSYGVIGRQPSDGPENFRGWTLSVDARNPYRARLTDAACLLISPRWIAVAVDHILLRVPEVGLPFIRWHLLFLPLNGGTPFRFLVSAGSLGGFATSQNDSEPEQRDQQERLHEAYYTTHSVARATQDREN